MKEMEVKFINSRVGFNKYKEDVWNILNISYKNLEGGLLSYNNDFETFNSRHHFLKVVEYPDLIACATYRKVLVKSTDTYKMVAIGCDQTKEGKDGLKLIVRDDIKSKNYIYWAEVSGAIEYYFERFYGYKIANCYAKEILGKGNIILGEDGFHYTRRIGKSKNKFTKVIYGFKDKETFEYINKCLDDTELPKGRLFESSSRLTHNDIVTQIYLAYDIIEAIYSANEDSGIYELFPNWYNLLAKTIEVLNKYENNIKRRDYYVEQAEYLLDTMSIVELKPLIID